MSKKRAERNQAATSYSVGIVNDGLLLDARSEYRAAGVDFDVRGPSFLDTDLLTNEGTVTLDDVEGYHTVTATRIVSNRLIGDVVFISTGGGVNAEIWPYDDGSILIDSSGGQVDLFLPYGGDYDVEIWGDIEHARYHPRSPRHNRRRRAGTDLPDHRWNRSKSTRHHTAKSRR